MAYQPLSLNMEFFSDPTTGKPLTGGSVYIGTQDLDPEIEANRVSVIVVQEDGTEVTITASAQPLSLVGGRIQYVGQPVVVKVDGAYSIKVMDRLDNQVYYAPRVNVVDVTPSSAGTNLQNGSFEIETVTGQSDNWSFDPTATGSVSPDSTSQAHGLKSLKFISVDVTGAGTATSDKFDVADNVDLDIRFIYKSSNAATLNKVQIKYYNAAGAPISTVDVYSNGTTNPTSYTPYFRRTTPPAGAVEAEIILTGMDASGTVTSGNTNFDGVDYSQANPVLTTNNVDNAVNSLSVSDAVTGVNPAISAEGEANTGIIVNDSNGNEMLIAESVASAVNEITMTNAAAGNKPSINQTGSDDAGIDIEGVEIHNGKINGVSPNFRGCLVYLTSNYVLATSATYDISFTSESYDTDSIHDNSVNPTRLTVPSGITKVRMSGSVYFAGGTTGHKNMSMLYNGVGLQPGGFDMFVASDASVTGYKLTSSSAVFEVTGGDYFEVRVTQNSGSNSTLQANSTWFSMEIIE